MDDVPGCLACDLSAGRLPLPGGRIHETERWAVEHCVGPLGVGALVVKPRRHVVAVGELRADEAAELGPLLARTAAIVDELVQPEQVYVGLWSHAGRVRVHIHFVVQPATTEAIDAVGSTVRGSSPGSSSGVPSRTRRRWRRSRTGRVWRSVTGCSVADRSCSGLPSGPSGRRCLTAFAMTEVGASVAVVGRPRRIAAGRAVSRIVPGFAGFSIDVGRDVR